MAPVLLTALACLTGCGGGSGDDKPGSGQEARPAETPKAAVSRIAAAVHAGDCDSPGQLFQVTPDLTQAMCRQLLPRIEPAPDPNLRTYGTGVLMRGARGDTVILVLDEERRFKVVSMFHGRDDLKVPVEKAERPMSLLVRALRRNLCFEVAQLSIVSGPPSNGAGFCALQPIRRLRAALLSDPTVKPALIGGDGSAAFYGLTARGHYYTLVFAAVRGRTYRFLMSVETARDPG